MEPVRQLRIALGQLNTNVGDISGNLQKILHALKQAEHAGCDLAVFPELAICGYPPEDLLMKNRFISDCAKAIEDLAGQTGKCRALVGYPAKQECHNKQKSKSTPGNRNRQEIVSSSRREPALTNSVALLGDGQILAVSHKTHLPNYAVFDERRYFRGGEPAPAIEIGGVLVGISICEDLWEDLSVESNTIRQIISSGAEVIVNINASPYNIGKWDERWQLLKSRCLEFGIPFVYVNQVGGQDELVFDGFSTVVDGSGEIIARAAQFVEEVLIAQVPVGKPAESESAANPRNQLAHQNQIATPLEPLAEIYAALKLGITDYVTKNGFEKVCVGLSGGVDSSLVATIATDALGKEKVHGVLMPSRYSSEHSLSDAKELCANLGIAYHVIPIEPAHQALLEMLRDSLGSCDVDTSTDMTDQNLQSRIRGIVLMAFANSKGWLNLTTGNKSEVAVGYSTLYGDTAGAFGVLKDVWKQQVYALAEFRNSEFFDTGSLDTGFPSSSKNTIPANVLTKPPSAELRPDQKDEDSLPAYEILDNLLISLVEQDLTASELIQDGYEKELVHRIARLVDLAEYKRRQSPLGVRITRKAFGKDRRMPITHSYTGK